MTTANTQVAQILLKRGNTTQSSSYVGPLGEVTLDTGLDTLRIHDGVTPGGFSTLATKADIDQVNSDIGNISLGVIDTAPIIANVQAAITSTINANVTAANLAIARLDANLGTATTNITSLLSNAVTQEGHITSLTASVSTISTNVSALVANAAAQEVHINLLNANITAANAAIALLQGNASTQSTELIELLSNASAQHDSLVSLLANAAVQAEYLANLDIATSDRLVNGSYEAVLGADGQLTVPGAIFRDGGLYMNSSGSTTAASVFVSGNSGSVILRTADNAEQVSYDLILDVNGETSFPGRLNFSDGSTLGDNILTGAIDSDLGLEIKRIVTVSGAHMGPNSPDVLLVDITEDDDITIVQAGWELNTGSEIAPIWLPVETVSRNENVYYLIAVSGVTFETGVTYTFRNPVPESQTWFIRNQTGGLVAPGGAIITNETAPLGGGSTYRELAIELPTPDGLNEQRWVFANDGDFTAPGDINAGYFIGQSLQITDAGVVSSTYDGDLPTLHVTGIVGGGLTLGTNGGLTSWLFKPDGTITLPAGGDIVDSNGDSVLGGGGADLGNLEIDSRTILTDIDQDITIQTSYRRTITAVAGPGTGSSLIVVDISEIDDVVEMTGAGGWEVNLNVEGEVPYWKEFAAATTNVMNNTFVISFTGFSGDDYNYPSFAQGTTYTFRKIQEDISQWTFTDQGTLATPAGGAISHRNNDLRIAVSGETDVIVLGTAAGELIINSDGTTVFPGLLHLNYNGSEVGFIDTTEDGISIGGALNKVVAIQTDNDEDNELGQSTWLFRSNGRIEFPDGTLQETAYTGGEVSPSVPRSDSAPSASNGQLWFNTEEARMYIKYNDQWVDASPTVLTPPETDIDVNSITFSDATVLTTAPQGNRLVNGAHEVALDSDGVLRLADDLILPRGSRWIKDCEGSGGTTSMRWYNVPTSDEVELLRVYSGEAPDEENTERTKISLEWQDTDVSGLSITAFDRTEGSTEHKWEFKGDGTTVFPTLTVPISDNANPSGVGQTLKFSDPTQQAIIYGPPSTADNQNAERIIIQGAPGYAGTAGEGGDVYLWAGPGGDAAGDGGDIKIRAGRGQGTGSGGYLNFQAGQSGTGSGGYINIESGYSNTYGSGGAITVQARSGAVITLRTTNSEGNSRDWIFGNNGSITFPDSTVQTTAYTGANTTVAKTGGSSTSGTVLTLTPSPTTNANWQELYFTDYVVADLTITFDVGTPGSLGGDGVTIGAFSSSESHSVGDWFTIDGAVLGGTSGIDDLTLTVTAVNTTPATAIDLTKTVNKLANGEYTLANGVEGQILYFVPQTGTTDGGISITIANARVLDDGGTPTATVYTDIDYRPFVPSTGSPIANVVTLIYTDGAWQASGGSFD